MKAIVFRAYGKPEEVLKLEEIPTPVCGDEEVLVKIKARSVNPSDLYTIKFLFISYFEQNGGSCWLSA